MGRVALPLEALGEEPSCLFLLLVAVASSVSLGFTPVSATDLPLGITMSKLPSLIKTPAVGNRAPQI